jgi:hypothetical protein
MDTIFFAATILGGIVLMVSFIMAVMQQDR